MSKNKDLLSFRFDFEGLSECPLCGGEVMIPNGRVEWLTMDFWYVACPQCGLKYMNPRPTQESYKTFYKDYFWQQKVRNIGFFQKGQMWDLDGYTWDTDKKTDKEKGKDNKQKKLKALRFEPVSSALLKYKKLKKGSDILEVGTSFPVTLNELHKQYGVKTYAIEPSEEARLEIKKHKYISLIGRYAEDLEKLSQKKQKFDAIIFSHSLENTVIPFDIMAWAKKSLKKGGIIYVQCSNLITYDQMNPYHPYIFSSAPFSLLAKKLKMKLKQLSSPKDRMLTVIFEK
ncbi:hypothetical protein CL654_02785 [bacterium]|nr:hypothetical protein [bacterium]